MSSTPAPRTREAFQSRYAFILAAIGSAVGLGNIWRFPYVAYDNGGGAFMIPYLVALLTAGIPVLFLDYAIGHRFQGSPPLAYRRMARAAEPIGWWQMGICFVIGVYYAVIIAWAGMYTVLSFTKGWGKDPKAYLFGDFLKLADKPGVEFSFVWPIFGVLALVWLVTIAALAAGVQNGIAKVSIVFIPLLVVSFLVLVVIAMTLPGASTGLDALFKPDWSALTHPGVWVAAYGQIFFSLSVAFGIMITYASYLKRKTDLTGSGLVVAFANSGFELLAAFGVFAVLGFMSQASGTPISKVAGDGIGLAFVAFPAIINEAGALGIVIGVLFFASLVMAGFTSLVSIVEVVVSTVRDKTGWGRVPATLAVGGAMAVISLLLFPTTTGLYLLDTSDAFVNNLGIVGAAIASMVVVTFALRKLPELARHVNSVSSFTLGPLWYFVVGGLTPAVLMYLLINDVIDKAKNGYEGYPGWFNGVFGWGMSAALIVIALLMSLLPWHDRSSLHQQATYEDQHVTEEELA
ncbi:sodium-dependent transporter [Aestuariimicrobium sp. p3-SID1156]|uniref:sodium-dependent transporter n=1 Tax=Aestuariimicrobium sp. p3-SID1156 TaxID=2916038 RepID=UPI00223BBB4B|nr:sodium-dependent transporter [Aestuariimicrobium sp. p3-SID1156]MCT1460288.1 sodium-dependent transporter [Aestuariimicrobium sp. p3-SID1156]